MPTPRVIGMRRGIGALGALAMVLALTGCGGSSLPKQAAVTSPRTQTASASPTDGDGALVPPGLDTSGSSGTDSGGSPVIGADVSWPQCPKGMGIPQKRSKGLPMPDDSARFVILGLTNGPSFVANPCLADQVAWARSRHLWAGAYSVVSYPDPRTLDRFRHAGPFDGDRTDGALSNAGYQAALFNVATMKRVGLLPPFVWVDVETVPHFPWSGSIAANVAVIRGVVRGYESEGLRVGFYSVLSLWRAVVGQLSLRLPEWRAAGKTSAKEAARRCESGAWSFNGGAGVIGQWVADGRDLDVTCSAAGSDLATWFRRL